MFDFGQNGEIVEDEFTLLMWAVASAFSRLGLIAMPSEEDLEFFAGSLYTTKKGQTFEAIDREQLLKWVEESEFARFLLEQVRLVPKLEGIIGTLKTHVGTLRADYRAKRGGVGTEAGAAAETEEEEEAATKVRELFDAEISGDVAHPNLKSPSPKEEDATQVKESKEEKETETKEEIDEKVEAKEEGNKSEDKLAGDEDDEQDKDDQDEDDEDLNIFTDRGWFTMNRPLKTCDNSVEILTGPIIGTVTDTTATVMLELDSPTTVMLHICLISGITKDSVRFLPPPPDPLMGNGLRREMQAHERLVQSIAVRCSHSVFVGKAIRGQKVGTGPLVVRITGLTPRSTYRVICTGVSASSSGNRVGSFRTLSTTKFVRLPGHGTGIVLDPLYFDDDSDDTITMASGMKFRANEGRMLNEGLTLCLAPSRDIRGSANRMTGDSSLLDPSNSLWHQLWDSAVCRGKIDCIVHIGNQVDLRSAIDDVAYLLREKDVKAELYEIGGGGDWDGVAGIEAKTSSEISKELSALMRDRMRQPYRDFWNLPHVREALAHCPNVIVCTSAEDDNGYIEDVVPLAWRDRVKGLCKAVRREYRDMLLPPEERAQEDLVVDDEAADNDDDASNEVEDGSANSTAFRMWGRTGFFPMDESWTRNGATDTDVKKLEEALANTHLQVMIFPCAEDALSAIESAERYSALGRAFSML